MRRTAALVREGGKVPSPCPTPTDPPLALPESVGCQCILRGLGLNTLDFLPFLRLLTGEGELLTRKL